MNAKEKKRLQQFFEKKLFTDTLPFWEQHSVDPQFGGFTDYLDQAGNRLSDEKGGWVQGRATWLFSWVYNHLDPNERWLNVAKQGARFLMEHGFDAEGRMFFRYKRNGEPIVQRRYLFTEVFGVMGLAEYSRAAKDREALSLALRTAQLIETKLADNSLPPKILPEAYRLKGHSITMILINMYQTLREVTGDPSWNAKIDRQIEELFHFFVRPDFKAVLEVVQTDGSILDTPEGRTINPGHAIETAWFLLEEAAFRNDSQLQQSALEILNWNLQKGWDVKNGGLFSFLDLKGLHPAPIEWDMKYWWPHCEMIIATLMASLQTGERDYEAWLKKGLKYAYKKFPDKKNGEWFGYLRRDGSVALTVKGNHFKGPFHIPRMEAKAIALLRKG